MCFAVSNPFRSGIDMSNRITSGLSAIAFSIASVPFAASPQTVQPSRDLKREHIPLLIMSLSSAMSIRFERLFVVIQARHHSTRASGPPESGVAIKWRERIQTVIIFGSRQNGGPFQGSEVSAADAVF
jgi:hypothetical protein